MTTQLVVFAVVCIYSPAVQAVLDETEIEYWEPGGDVYEGEELTLYVKTAEDQEALIAAITEAQTEAADEEAEEDSANQELFDINEREVD